MKHRLDPCLLSAQAATVLLGLMAGFFFAFAVDVAPAMTHLSGPAYVETQQWINRAVRNATFGAVYFGSTVLAFAPAVMAGLTQRRALAMAWTALALVYFVAVFWLTRSINVPINEAMAAWNPTAPPVDWAMWRDRWNEANEWRAWASFGCFVVATVLTTLSRSCAAIAPMRRVGTSAA